MIIPVTFEARPVTDKPWIWEVWDTSHPAECNQFPIIIVDSKGAAEDFHEPLAKEIAAFLNSQKKTTEC